MAPPCPHYVADRCGGCQLQHLAYEAQLEVSRSVLREIGADAVPSRLVLNKMDRVDAARRAAILERPFRRSDPDKRRQRPPIRCCQRKKAGPGEPGSGLAASRSGVTSIEKHLR